MVKWNRNNEMAFQLCKYQILKMNEMLFSLTKTETISLLKINIYIYIVELEKKHVIFTFC